MMGSDNILCIIGRGLSDIPFNRDRNIEGNFRMMRRLLLALFTLALFATACSSDGETETADDTAAPATTEAMEEEETATTEAMEEEETATTEAMEEEEEPEVVEFEDVAILVRVFF